MARFVYILTPHMCTFDHAQANGSLFLQNRKYCRVSIILRNVLVLSLSLYVWIIKKLLIVKDPWVVRSESSHV